MVFRELWKLQDDFEIRLPSGGRAWDGGESSRGHLSHERGDIGSSLQDRVEVS